MRESLVDKEAVERLLLLNGALRSGIVDALASGEGQSAVQVAELAETDLRATRIILEALVAQGIAEDAGSGSGYRLSARGRAHLVEPGPRCERFSILHLANRVRGWLNLPEVIRSGEATQGDAAHRDVRSFAAAMAEREPEFLEEVVRVCLEYAGSPETMIDLGGAVGHVACRFVEAGLQATLFERPEVIAVAKEFLGPRADELNLVAGDLTEALPSGPYDLAYLGNVLHIYGPATNQRVIAAVGDILNPGGTIAIQEHVGGRSPRSAMFAVNMLQAATEGGVWSEQQYREWLAAAGFEAPRVIDLESTAAQLILARKPTSRSGLR